MLHHPDGAAYYEAVLAHHLSLPLTPAQVHDIGLAEVERIKGELTGNEGLIDPPESAAGLIARIDELTLDTSGGFWHSNGERLPW